MPDTPELGTVALLAFALVSACDSSAPPSDRLLQGQGEVLEAGQAPVPPLHVDLQAWPALGSDGSDRATLRTDAAGRYTVELGPFPEEADSLRVRVTQYDCEGQVETDLWRRDLGPGDSDALVLPTLALSYRLPVAEFGFGAEMCGAIVTRSTSAPELVDDHARLALWIDDVSDSVRGRWRLNHSATIGDDYGYFSGSEEPDRLVLQLRPTPPTPCTGLQLEIPFIAENSSRLGPGELTGDCAVPSTTVRFFQGAALSEVLPVGSETPYEPTAARLIGEFAGQAGNGFETYSLFLAVDQVDDSVRGLWSMSFQATCATHDGPFSGIIVGDQLQLRLRPDEDYEATLDLWLRVFPGDSVLRGPPVLVESGSVPGYVGPALCGSDQFDPVVLHQGEVEGMPIGR